MPIRADSLWLGTLLVVCQAVQGNGQPARETSLAPVKIYSAHDSLCVSKARDPDAQACLDQLSWSPEAFEVKVLPVPSRKSMFHVQFPSPKPCGVNSIDQVTCEWYAVADASGASPATRRSVVVVHESGSEMTVGRLIATELQRLGLHAFLVQLPGYGQRRSDEFVPGDLIQVFSQGLADVRRARDAVAAIEHVDASHIAIQGTSLGGFVASMAAGLDAGFDSQFLLLCGVDLHGVLTGGAKDAAKTLHRLLDSGLDRKDLESALYAVEPRRIVHRLNPKTTWLYSATFDRVVPPKFSLQLAEEIGLSSEHHVRMLANHYSGIIYLPGITKRIFDQVADNQID